MFDKISKYIYRNRCIGNGVQYICNNKAHNNTVFTKHIHYKSTWGLTELAEYRHYITVCIVFQTPLSDGTYFEELLKPNVVTMTCVLYYMPVNEMC